MIYNIKYLLRRISAGFTVPVRYSRRFLDFAAATHKRTVERRAALVCYAAAFVSKTAAEAARVAALVSEAEVAADKQADAIQARVDQACEAAVKRANEACEAAVKRAAEAESGLNAVCLTIRNMTQNIQLQPPTPVFSLHNAAQLLKYKHD